MKIEPFDIVLLVILLGAFSLCLIYLNNVIKEGFLRKRNLYIGFLFGSLLVSYSIYNVISHKIDPTGWAQIFLTLGLVIVTGQYALVAFRQANASMEMAKEMREQRINASKPLVVLKSVHEKDIFEGSMKDYFSHFEVLNVGNGPAIELEISLLDRLDIEKTSLHSHRKTFLQVGENFEFPFFNVAFLDVSRTYYLACEYQSILSYGAKTWYQSLLPFIPVKSSKENKIYVNAGELVFNEVSEKERIDAFNSRSKPK